MAEFVEVIKQKRRMCNAFEHCKISGCPLIKNCKTEGMHPREAEKIIMDWAKEHPVMTNADKAREVLGLNKEEFNLSQCCGIKCPYPPDRANACESCSKKGFWEQEWKDPKEKADE